MGLARPLNIIKAVKSIKAPFTHRNVREMTFTRQVHIQYKVREPDTHPSFVPIGIGNLNETIAWLKEVCTKTIPYYTMVHEYQAHATHS